MIQRAAQPKRRRIPRTLLLLHVTLRGVKPTIWRRVAVSGALSLDQLHVVLQVIMGWEFKHLYSFTIAGCEYDDPHGDDRDPSSPDPRKTRLDNLGLGLHNTFVYTYDFGDDWEHELTVEGVAPFTRFASAATFLGGERACPPEDSGGPEGYMELLAALRHPESPGAHERLEWLGRFDPDALDLRSIARTLEPPPSAVPSNKRLKLTARVD